MPEGIQIYNGQRSVIISEDMINWGLAPARIDTARSLEVIGNNGTYQFVAYNTLGRYRENFGLEVLNPNGGLVYHSSIPPLRILSRRVHRMNQGAYTHTHSGRLGYFVMDQRIEYELAETGNRRWAVTEYSISPSHPSYNRVTLTSSINRVDSGMGQMPYRLYGSAPLLDIIFVDLRNLTPTSGY